MPNNLRLDAPAPSWPLQNRFDLIFANSLNAKNDYSHKYLLPMKWRTMNLYILYTKSFYATTTIIVPNGANLSICDDLNHCHKYSSEWWANRNRNLDCAIPDYFYFIHIRVQLRLLKKFAHQMRDRYYDSKWSLPVKTWIRSPMILQ
jgi:hypothetical protein